MSVLQCYPYTVCSKIIGPSEFLPLDPLTNESCNIERCVNKMHKIVANMMFYLELKLTLL